jgi:hypothetical protein
MAAIAVILEILAMIKTIKHEAILIFRKKRKLYKMLGITKATNNVLRMVPL